jgi:hypothetical protein
MRDTLAFAWPRARAHWLAVLLIAAASTGVFVAWRAGVAPTFEASIVIRVVERDFDDKAKPPSSGELESFVNDVFLTRSTLLRIIEEQELYPDEMGPDPSLALEAMRDDLDIRVVQNYFAPERYIGEPIRSARVVVSYAGSTPDQALAVVRAIGKAFSAAKLRVRRTSARWAAAQAKVAQTTLYHQLISARRRQARLNLTAAKAPVALVTLVRTTDEVERLGHELDALRDKSGRLSLQRDLEEQQMAMRFELVDSGRRPSAGMSRRSQLALGGAVAFSLLLPLTALGLGTLGTRIVSERGVQRLGLKPLGTVPWPAAAKEER